MVIVPGIAETQIEANLWLILAPDCDAVRSDYVRVAPILMMDKDKSCYRIYEILV